MKKLIALIALLVTMTSSAHLHQQPGCTYVKHNPNPQLAQCAGPPEIDLYMQFYVLAQGAPPAGTVMAITVEQDLPDDITCTNLLWTWNKRYDGGSSFSDVPGKVTVEFTGERNDFHNPFCWQSGGGIP